TRPVPTEGSCLTMRLSIATHLVHAALFTALTGFCADTRAQAPVVPAPTQNISADASDDVAGEFRTTNFVVSGTTRGLARRFAERAEKHRKELAKQWLGKELPNWASPCRVQVELQQGRLGGLSTFDFQNQSAAWVPVRISVSGNVDGILTNTLPHEMTHAV